MNNSTIAILRDFIIAFVKSGLSLIKILLYSKIKCVIKAGKQHNNLIVLGNGPSLQNSLNDLGDSLMMYDLMCVNAFPCTDEFERIQPKYFITTAPEMWLETVDDSYIKWRKEIFGALATKTKWSMTILIPWQAKKSEDLQKCIQNNSYLKALFFNTTPVEGLSKFSNILFDLQLGMPRPHNVLIPSIMAGIHIGYKNIFLLGADHNWLGELSVDNDNNVLLRQKHFYDSNTATYRPMAKLGSGSRKMHEILHKFMLTFMGYHIVNQYAKSHSCKVINSTPGSFIDAFPRENSI